MKNSLFSILFISICVIPYFSSCGEKPNGLIPVESETEIFFEDVIFSLPETIPDWAQNYNENSKKVLWFDENGKTQIVQIPTNTRNFCLKLPQNSLTPIIILYSTTEKSGIETTDLSLFVSKITENAAGCIYPLSTDTTWLKAFSAFILFRIFSGVNENPTVQSDVRRYCSYFNWWKFENTIEEISSKYNGNPWIFDSEKIIKSIVTGTFSKNSIKVLQ